MAGKDQKNRGEALMERLGWFLSWAVLGSLAVLAILYLTDADLDRRVKNLPLPPDEPGITEPVYVVLWSIAAGGCVLMALWLGIEYYLRRKAQAPGQDETDMP